MSMLDSVLSQFEEDIKNNSDPNLQAISDYLLEKAEKSESGFVECLLEKGKSLSSCLNYILKKAFLQVTKGGTVRPEGNFAVSAVQHDCVFDWAVDYYRSEETDVKFDPMAMMPKPSATKTNTGAPAKKNQPQTKPQNLVSYPSLFDLVEKSEEQVTHLPESDKTGADDCGECESQLDESEPGDVLECENKDLEGSTYTLEDVKLTDLSKDNANADQTFILNPPRSGVIPVAEPVVEKTQEAQVVKLKFSEHQESTEPESEQFKDIPALPSEKKKRGKHATAVDYGQISLFAANY